MTIDRRFFLAGSLGATVAGTGFAGIVPASAAAEIGRAVLQARAVEPSAAALRQALGLLNNAPLAFDASWDDRIRADYSAGDTVHVENWVLSRTEARLCALAAQS